MKIFKISIMVCLFLLSTAAFGQQLACTTGMVVAPALPTSFAGNFNSLRESVPSEFEALKPHLSGACSATMENAVNCCLNTDQCGMPVTIPDSWSIGAMGIQIEQYIGTLINSQNDSAMRAYNCHSASNACASNCASEAPELQNNVNLLCTNLIAFEHNENALANTYLSNACTALENNYNQSVDADKISHDINCNLSGEGPRLCRFN